MKWELGFFGATKQDKPITVQDWDCDSEAVAPVVSPCSEPVAGGNKFALGDMASAALAKVGITEDRVTDWLGRPCGCNERRLKLNQFGQWVTNLLGGSATEDELNQLIK